MAILEVTSLFIRDYLGIMAISEYLSLAGSIDNKGVLYLSWE